MEQNEINNEINQLITRIREADDLDDEKKKLLLGLFLNSGSYDERAMDHPLETVKFMVRFGGEKILEESIPQVEEWTKANEPVSLFRIMVFLLKKYLNE